MLVLALLVGTIAGLRTLTAPAAISWAARLGRLDLGSTSLAFLGYAGTPWILTILALVELVVDQLPTTPSRTRPGPFAARIVSGGLSGLALGMSGGAPVAGLTAGVAGAVLGTLGGRAARARLAEAFGSDRPAALLEDAVAIGLALLVLVARP